MISKQQKYKQILRKQGLCVMCGKLSRESNRTEDGNSPYCDEHAEWMRNYSRNWMRKKRLRVKSSTVV